MVVLSLEKEVDVRTALKQVWTSNFDSQSAFEVSLLSLPGLKDGMSRVKISNTRR